MNATPMKLRSGEWGAKVQGKAQPGQVVTITTKAGKSWQAEVAKVIWTGADKGGKTISIVATSKINSGRSAECCGYPCPVTGRRCTPDDPCHDCM